MKKLLFLFIAGIANQTMDAQITLRVDNSLYTSAGRTLPIAGALPVSNTRNIELAEGSPFFYDKWTNSKVVTEQGEVYSEIKIKLNLMENKVHYQDESGKELVVGTPLLEIELEETPGKKVHFVQGSLLPVSKRGWYQLLHNDQMPLVKGFKKTFEGHRSYGSSTEYSIKTVETYYVFFNDREYEINKPSDFVNVLPALKTKIQAHIKSLSRKDAREEQIRSTAAYCNELLKS